MNLKHFGFLFVIVTLSALAGIAFLRGERGEMDTGRQKPEFLVGQAGHLLKVRGYQFAGYHRGKKNIAIRAARHTVEKKKAAFFRLGAVRVAKFTGAEIDIYAGQVESGPSSEDSGLKSRFRLKETFIKEAMPSSDLKNVASYIFEPVRINFYDGASLVTNIQADRASIKSKDRRVVFQGKVKVTSESASLATERLTFFPDSGVIETDRYFVFETPQNRLAGNGMTADLSLNQSTMTQTSH